MLRIEPLAFIFFDKRNKKLCYDIPMLGKKSYTLILSICIFIVFFILYNYHENSHERYFHQKLQEFIESDKEYIKLRNLTDFKWIIACPRNHYTAMIIDEEWFTSLNAFSYIDFYYDAVAKRIVYDYSIFQDYNDSMFKLDESKKTIAGCFNPSVKIKLDKHNKLNFFY